MNEKELKEMIAGFLSEMVADNHEVSTATVSAEDYPVTSHV
ncbi:ethanolamine ammonia-lyase subunit EutC, partial [Enterococcus faecalis]